MADWVTNTIDFNVNPDEFDAVVQYLEGEFANVWLKESAGGPGSYEGTYDTKWRPDEPDYDEIREVAPSFKCEWEY